MDGRNLTLVGIATWAVVVYTSLESRSVVWGACMIVFLAGFILATWSECPATRRRILAVVQTLAALAAMATAQRELGAAGPRGSKRGAESHGRAARHQQPHRGAAQDRARPPRPPRASSNRAEPQPRSGQPSRRRRREGADREVEGDHKGAPRRR